MPDPRTLTVHLATEVDPAAIREPLAHELAAAAADLVGPAWLIRWALAAMRVPDELADALVETALEAPHEEPGRG